MRTIVEGSSKGNSNRSMDWVATSSSGTGSSSSPKGKEAKKAKKEQKAGGGGGNGKQDLPPCYRAMMTQLARVSRDVEVLKACSFVSVKVKANDAIVKAGMGAGKAYAELVKKAGKNHSHGKPHCHVFGAMMGTLHTELDNGVKAAVQLPNIEIGRDTVSSFLSAHKGSAKLLEDKISHCVIRKQYKEETVKVESHITPAISTVSIILLEAWKHAGSEQYYGAGPRNPNERKFTNFLSKKKKEEDESSDDE